MKKIYFLLIICLLNFISYKAYSQSTIFSKVYYYSGYGIMGYDIANAYDRSTYIAGQIGNTPLLTKIDSAGNFLWSKEYGTVTGRFNLIIPTNDSCFMLAGHLANSITNNNEVTLLKINASGDTIWSKNIVQSDYAIPFAIQQTADSGFVITGYVENTAVPENAFLTKIDKNGTIQWNQYITSGSDNYYGRAVKQTPDGGYALLCTVYSSSTTFSAIVKLAANGTFQWANKYTDIEQSVAIDMDVTNSGIISYIAHGYNYTFMKTDLSGTILWQKNYSVFNQSICLNCTYSKITRCSDGGYVGLTGIEYSHINTQMIRIDSTGNLMWANDLFCTGVSVTEAKDSGFSILGYGPLYGVERSAMPPNYDQIAVLKTNALGNGYLCLNNSSAAASADSFVASAVPVTVSSSAASISAIYPVIIPRSMVTENGCVTFLGGIDENETSSVIIFPNPSAGQFNFSGLEKGNNIEVYDVLGNKVFNTIVSDEQQIIDISSKATGIYFYRIFNKMEIVQQGKICVE